MVVTATKGNLPPGTATSAAVVVNYTTSTDLKLSRYVSFSWQTTKATVTVKTDEKAKPTGSVVISVNGNAVSTVPVTASDSGKVSVNLPKFASGVYLVTAEFMPSNTTTTDGSTSNPRVLIILF